MLTGLKLVLSDPLASWQRVRALCRYLLWQVRSRITRAPHVVTYADGRTLQAYPGMTTVIRNHLVGVRDCSEMALLLHALGRNGLCLDLGANAVVDNEGYRGSPG